MVIYNIKDKLEYLEEIVVLTKKEWENGEITKAKLKEKINKITADLARNDYCKLILLDNDKLVGFVSIFPTDGDEEKHLTPWYATMYIKKEYRRQGYSKILNEAILKEAREGGFKKLYLKTNLNNYYEKLGAKYKKTLKNGEKLYYIET